MLAGANKASTVTVAILVALAATTGLVTALSMISQTALAATPHGGGSGCGTGGGSPFIDCSSGSGFTGGGGSGGGGSGSSTDGGGIGGGIGIGSSDFGLVHCGQGGGSC